MRNFLTVLVVLSMSLAAFASPTSFLLDAVMNSDITPQQIQALIKSGANVKYSDKYGNTALIKAASFASPEVIKILIDSGSDVNAVNIIGFTALLNAAETNRNPEVIKILVSAGANVNFKGEKGR